MTRITSALRAHANYLEATTLKSEIAARLCRDAAIGNLTAIERRALAATAGVLRDAAGAV